VPTLDEVIEGIATAAKADFAFVLTRRGRLVTKTAPRDMPDAGRRRLTKLASSLPRDGKEIAQATLAREQLVPYGGAAPVDVYVTAIDQAVVCVAMASWADKKSVVAAIEAAQPFIETLLAAALKRRGPSRSRASTKSSPPRPGARRGGRLASSPPPRRGRSRPPPPKIGLVQLAGSNVVPSERMKTPPDIQQSEPEASSPPASQPDITVGVAALGRESLAAIDQEELDRVPTGRDMASSPDLRISLASLPDISEQEARVTQVDLLPRAGSDDPGRRTLPWVETAADAKRSADAARLGRNVAPRVAVRMQSLAENELSAILDEETANEEAEAAVAQTEEVEEVSGTVSLLGSVDEEPQSGPVAVSPRGQKSPARPTPRSVRPPRPEEDGASLELWRDAITRMIDSERGRSVPPAPGPAAPRPAAPNAPKSNHSKSSAPKSGAPKSGASGTRSKSSATKKGPTRSGGSSR